MEYTHLELIQRDIDRHIDKVTVEWNEPEDRRIGMSVCECADDGDDGIFVITPVEYRYRTGAHQWGPWNSCIVFAAYRFENPDPLRVIVFNDDGTTGYDPNASETYKERF